MIDDLPVNLVVSCDPGPSLTLHCPLLRVRAVGWRASLGTGLLLWHTPSSGDLPRVWRTAGRRRGESQADVSHAQLAAAQATETGRSFWAAGRPTSSAHKERVLHVHVHQLLRKRRYLAPGRAMHYTLIAIKRQHWTTLDKCKQD